MHCLPKLNILFRRFEVLRGSKRNDYKKCERTDKGMDEKNQIEERKYQIRKRELCRFILEKLSDNREEKWNIEKETMKALEKNERYQQIKNLIVNLEETFDYLMLHTDQEIRKEIDSLEEEVRTWTGELKERRRLDG